MSADKYAEVRNAALSGDSPTTRMIEKALAAEDELDNIGQDEAAPHTDLIVHVGKLGKYYPLTAEGIDLSYAMHKEGAETYLIGTCGVPFARAKAILKHRQHPCVDTVACEPGDRAVFRRPDGEKVANTYVKSACIPKQGDWPKIFTLLLILTNAITDGGAGIRWLFNWMAAKYQRPGTISGTSVTFTGHQGDGKSAPGEFLKFLLGERNCVTVVGANLNSGFNSIIASKLFAVVNEATQPKQDTYTMSEKLKAWHTEKTIVMNMKGIPEIELPNRLSFWITSNLPLPVKVEENDRRYTIFAVPKSVSSPEHTAFVDSMFDKEAMAPTAETLEELSALAYDLQHWPVDWKLARSVFKNEDRDSAAAANRNGLQAFFAEVKDTNGLAVMEWVRRYQGTRECKDDDAWTAFTDSGLLKTEAVFRAYTTFVVAGHFAQRGPTAVNRFSAAWKKEFGDRWPVSQESTGLRLSYITGLPLTSAAPTAEELEATKLALGRASPAELALALAGNSNDPALARATTEALLATLRTAYKANGELFKT